jgi:hypothetical protein
MTMETQRLETLQDVVSLGHLQVLQHAGISEGQACDLHWRTERE